MKKWTVTNILPMNILTTGEKMTQRQIFDKSGKLATRDELIDKVKEL